MPEIPRAPGLDNTLSFLREAYSFVSRRCDRLGSDLFRTRIMLTPVVCMRGAEAARIFYEGDRFTRRGAMPQTTLRLLQDKGSVQSLDGVAHRHRKGLFMSLMTPDSVVRTADLLEKHWRDVLTRWQAAKEVVLMREMGELLTRTACDWTGVPLAPRDVPALAHELQMMIRQAGHLGPATLWALHLRRRTERRIRRLVGQVRAGEISLSEDSALSAIVRHTDQAGKPLDTATVAVEIINLLRPMVAVRRFITFAALALYEHPSWRERLATAEEDLEPFVQEVRRFYPFFPVIGGRVRQGFDWSGHHFAKGDWAILDLYGTNHDCRSWDEPEQFRPERFRNWKGDAFTLVPQGAGDFMGGHRCPGEWITIALMKRAVRLLCAMRYDVPPQDLSISLSRMPTAPRSGFVISRVRMAQH
ncbi:cytochrome P450 [Roseomonas chloroacetimidivorans]|uniref:cytochrome P450 n=1 Tax=Roseomonas chloroacetimidivorans TaxID=1766656 RepID=UPI003C753295